MALEPAPILTLTIDLEGPIRIYPLCDTAEEETRLALDITIREESVHAAVQDWARGVLERMEKAA